MNYNWEMNFSILLTLIIAILGVISNVISWIFKYKDKKKALYETIYFKAIELIEYPIKLRKNIKYKHKNPIIEKIMKRKISDHINEVDTFWTYYSNPTEPELEDFPQDKQVKYSRYITKEFHRYLWGKFDNNAPLSPVFYYGTKECKYNIDSILNVCILNKSKLNTKAKHIMQRVISNPPKVVYEKYNTQVKRDKDYFTYNEPLFDDPYRDLIINIKKEYEKLNKLLVLRAYENVKEKVLRFKYRKVEL